MAVKINNQSITKRWAIYNDDCMKVLPNLKDESVDFCIFSPPFVTMYTFSDADEDFANASSYDKFFDHFTFLVEELLRLMTPGRIVAVHCMDIPTYKRSGDEIGLRDFPGGIIRTFEEKGFVYHSRHCIWKDPLVAATRTKTIGLAHKQLVKDSSMSRMGIPDYILGFRKPGENLKPIKNPRGLIEYAGSRPVPKDLDRFIREHDKEHGEGIEKNPYNPGKDKRSHWIWQQYASPVWFDIRQTNVLPFIEGRDKDDQRHICPLQIDTIQRCTTLWSTEGDIVFTPFMGVGSEVYVAVKNGRKGIGIELKKSYFRQAVRNLESLETKNKAKVFSNGRE